MSRPWPTPRPPLVAFADPSAPTAEEARAALDGFNDYRGKWAEADSAARYQEAVAREALEALREVDPERWAELTRFGRRPRGIELRSAA